jgi:hypothetical protein
MAQAKTFLAARSDAAARIGSSVISGSASSRQARHTGVCFVLAGHRVKMMT